ncbi:uncharacterized protein LOC131945167 [Physella acuta]|uniref:uncharacterized protein LOC131945167 n=1 Tax=Physella acuta TaxID=109671 RepID=UPI0027DCD64D|nr:uncharacterized protein LOC131945167 [Physella acuta]
MFYEDLKESSDNISMASGGEDNLYCTGTYEVQECLEGQREVDLHTHHASCTKNPGHQEFVPVNQIIAEHFSPGNHYNDVYDLTKALADLTVRIAVKLTSPDRPVVDDSTVLVVHVIVPVKRCELHTIVVN